MYQMCCSYTCMYTMLIIFKQNKKIAGIFGFKYKNGLYLQKIRCNPITNRTSKAPSKALT